MEIKKVMVMLKKVHNFLVWEYCYSGDRGNNGARTPVPGGKSAHREMICRGISSLWEELSTQQLSPRTRGAELKAAAGGTEGP